MSEAEEAFLLQSLRDLDAEKAAGDIDDRDYAELRDDYTAHAAAALRGESVLPEPGRRRRWPIVAVIVLFAVLAGAFVANTAGQRLPNQASSGSIATSSAERLGLARQYIADGKAVDALKTYDSVLKDDPKNPEALAYRGWLLRLAGLPNEGLVYIDRAIAADASYPDAHFFRAMILWKDRKDAAGAVPEFRAFLAANPPTDRVGAVEDALKQAEAEATAGG